MIKIIQRIPMDNAGYSFGYIEFEGEYESPAEAIAENASLVASVGNPGLSTLDFSRIRDKMIFEGYEPNTDEYEALSRYQRKWVSDTKNTMRKAKRLQEEEAVIN